MVCTTRHDPRLLLVLRGVQDHMEEHLQASRSGIPRTHARRHVLSGDYFRMIEAVE